MEKLAKTLTHVTLRPALQPAGKALCEIAKSACENMADETGGEAFVKALAKALDVLQESKQIVDTPKEAPKKKPKKKAKTEEKPVETEETKDE